MDQQEQIRQLASEGLSRLEVAKRLGVNSVWLWKLAKRWGIVFPKTRSRLKKEEEEALVEKLRSEPRLRREDLGLTIGVYKRIRRLAGVKAPLKYGPDEWSKAAGRFGLEVVEHGSLSTSGSILLKCHCGREFEARSSSVIRPEGVHSCGCQTSYPEVEIAEFIQGLGLQVERRRTDLLSGRREVDIFVPERMVAIEYCGLMWHSHERKRDKRFHELKFRELEKKGIRLLTIFEDEWLCRREVVLSVLASKLGCIERRLAARQLSVTWDAAKCRAFLQESHLQGARGLVYLGLEKDGQLWAAMSFQKNHRFTRGWELSRYASRRGSSVVGGFSKLLVSFSRRHPGEEIVSLSDNRWSDGGVYKKNGFSLLRESHADYSYIVGKKRLHKAAFKLANLKKSGLWLPGETEREATQRLGYSRIYDCGKRTWRLDVGAEPV